jgi:hypothetical protein
MDTTDPAGDFEPHRKFVRFYESVRGGFPPLHSASRTTLNGLPGFVFHTSEGTETIAFEIANGAIIAIYAVRNPDKVGHLAE